MIADVFPDNFKYICQKLPEYAEKIDTLDFQKGANHAEHVAEILHEVEARLGDRDYQFFRIKLGHAIYAVERLRDFFENHTESTLTVDDAFIFGCYIETTAQKIRDTAINIDQENK